MTKHKHLTLSDRNDIQLGLERGETFKAIGRLILKDPTTVSKEVKRNRQVRESTCHNLPCPLLDKAPFVCNGCPKRRQNCGYQKIFYLAKQAQKQYEQTLVEAREGTPLNSQTFWDIDKVISDGVKKGQHIYHILKTHNLNVSSSTVYRHIRKGYLSIAPIDLARAVKFKERRKNNLPSIYLSVTLSSLGFWRIKLPLRLPNTSMISRTLFTKRTKISSNSSLSF